MPDPLNPQLFGLLKRRFGRVKIASAGINQVGRYMRDPFRGYDILSLVEPGEYYQVCCPYCSDTRFRLYVNHRWGVRDSQGHQNLWMAICFNETMCMNSYQRREDLLEQLTEHPDVLAKAKIVPGKDIDPDEVIMEWPGPVTRVDRLPPDHKAVRYLISRSFDPEKAGRFYNVHFCHDSFRWLAKERLIIPIYSGGVMRGWQARYVGDINWKKAGAPPKYYTCPGTPRRSLVYNLANAAHYRTGVIMEGPTDVWSLGPMGVCTLGATMTVPQQRLFYKAFAQHAAILLYDPDVREDRKKWPAIERLAQTLDGKFARGFATVWLPEGRDPGNMDRQFLRQYITEQAREQGVKVDWRKR